MMNKGNLAHLALRFVIIIGIVNLFADFTYEGGRSIMGPFLATLGANGTIVGFVAGFGELLGFGLRSVSGYIGEKTRKFWVITFIGYTINMFAVPALALAGNWQTAAALMILERTGRAIRRPNVETMLSYTTGQMGAGWVFGLNEALDQGGATVGPLIVALVLYLKGGYREQLCNPDYFRPFMFGGTGGRQNSISASAGFRTEQRQNFFRQKDFPRRTGFMSWEEH